MMKHELMTTGKLGKCLKGLCSCMVVNVSPSQEQIKIYSEFLKEY